jgi:hypothetical protein
VREEEFGALGVGPQSTAMASPCASAVPPLAFVGVPGPGCRERFDIMKHDECGFNEIEAQVRVSPLYKSWA